MPRLVTLHIYSQRPDPYWFLTEEQEDELSRRLGRLREPSLLKARGGVPIFGYRGFSLGVLPASGPLMGINQGIVDPDPAESGFFDADRTIERFLLETGGDAVPPEVREDVLTTFSEP